MSSAREARPRIGGRDVEVESHRAPAADHLLPGLHARRSSRSTRSCTVD
ncbi:hypothetical protein A7982_12398 [Minicystis rosea]|nr:hypothetical protein A7982_12398 [Minicystis rosea]